MRAADCGPRELGSRTIGPVGLKSHSIRRRAALSFLVDRIEHTLARCTTAVANDGYTTAAGCATAAGYATAALFSVLASPALAQDSQSLVREAKNPFADVTNLQVIYDANLGCNPVMRPSRC